MALELHAPGHAVTVAGDAGAIAVALSNLAENAIRHADARTVRVHVRPGGGVSVEDDGRDIPATEAGRLFEPFRRGPDAAAGGAGLGLAIVARVARAHGTQAEYRRLPRGGSAFSLDLPENRRKA
ncbi:MAG: ATP-binding protein [Paracoccaceae bacterium]|nr:ATP-binding protein [Paracoccaceae bacterium]